MVFLPPKKKKKKFEVLTCAFEKNGGLKNAMYQKGVIDK